MQETEKYKLKKPDPEDFFNIEDFNENADKIEAALSENAKEIDKKAGKTLASKTANGLMSNTDKTKLDGIDEEANNYTHPSNHPASIIIEDSTHRFVSDVCKTITDWNNAITNGWFMGNNLANAPTGGWCFGEVITHNTKYLIQIVYAFTISTDARLNTKYIRAKVNDKWGEWSDVTVQKKVPSDAKFTDTTYSNATQSANGLMSITDKKKLDDIAEGANNYTHPSNHPASMIIEDSTHRFVKDAEKTAWNAKASTDVATASKNGLMSVADKTKLDGIAGANNLTTTVPGFFLDARMGKELDDKKLDKSGGTVSGQLKLEKGSYVHTSVGTMGVKGYVKLAVITTNKLYPNSPLQFEILRRRGKQSSVLTLTFTTIASITDPDVQSLTYCGEECDAFVVKAGTGIWHLYVKKNDPSDYVTVVKFSSLNEKIDPAVEWIKYEQVSDKLENAISAILLLNASNAIIANKLDTARQVTVGGHFDGQFSFDGSSNVGFNLYGKHIMSLKDNQNNYPYHRFAKLDKITVNHRDDGIVFMLHQTYGNRFGIVRVESRREGSTAYPSKLFVQWLVRIGFNEDDVQAGFSKDYDNTYVDLFLKYHMIHDNAVVTILDSSYRFNIGSNWILVESKEVANTTATNKLTSYECWKTIEEAGQELHGQAYSSIIAASDSSSVKYSNISDISTYRNVTYVNGIDILNHIKSNYIQLRNHIVKGCDCTNSPISSSRNDFIYEVYTINNTNFLRVIAHDVRTNKSYSNALINGSWTGWSTIIDSANYKDFVTPDSIGAALKSHTHKATDIIDDDPNNRFVSEAEKSVWHAKLGTENVANNLSTILEGFVLDARMGKYLKDLIDQKFDKSGGTISGNTTVNQTEITDTYINIGNGVNGQKRLYMYSTPTYDSGNKANHQVRLYGGASDSATALGIYDAFNAIAVLAYEDGNTATGATGGTKKLKVNSGVTFSATGTVSSSDERLKYDFNNLAKFEKFFYDIEPCSFKYKNGTSGRDWIGVKAQQIEKALLDNGITLKEFAGVTIEQKTEDSDDWREITDEYGVRYEQFIMLNTYMIQKQKKEIDSLRNELSELKKEIKNMKGE